MSHPPVCRNRGAGAHRQTRMRRTTAVLISLGVALTAGLAGCSQATSRTSAGNAAPALAPGQDNAKPEDGKVAAGAGAVAGKPAAPVVATQRSIVYRGSITVRVSDVTAKAAELTSLAIGAGGLIGGDERP